MKINIFILGLGILFFESCKTYILKDNTSLFELDSQKKECFLNQKIELLGFSILLDSTKSEGSLSPVQFSSLESKITDNEHLKIIRFVNARGRIILPENKNSFTTFSGTGSRSQAVIIKDKYLDKNLNSKKYFLETNKKYTNRALNLEEKRVREFLATFLNHFKHLGLDEVSLLLDLKDNQIRLKNSDKDYYIIGVHEHKSNINHLNAFISFFTLGILPTYSEEIIFSRFYLYRLPKVIAHLLSINSIGTYI
jgi:hypothetical protein